MRLSGLCSLKSNEIFARGRGRREVALKQREGQRWGYDFPRLEAFFQLLNQIAMS